MPCPVYIFFPPLRHAAARLSISLPPLSMATGSSSGDGGAAITVERSLPHSRLKELGITSWPKWGCPPGRFPLRFEAQETCYFLKGRVKAHVKGASPETVEFGAGDLVIFPKGLSCTWDVSVAVDKHYKFDSSS